MAKVKIQGHASGTGVLTVTAPNTSTDRTITLPDSTGTLATTDDNGSQLDHSGTKKIEAVSTGAQIQNRLEVITPNDSSTHLVQRLGSTDGSYGYVDLELVSPNSTAAGLPRLDLQVGNSTVASFLRGGGITFNGDTAAANALDDYEEGTYNAVISGGTSGTFNMDSNDTLAYTKVGRLVSVQGYIGVSSGSVSGNLRMTLPFTPTSLPDDAQYNFSSLFIANTGNTNSGQKYLFLTGDAYGWFYKVEDSGSAGYMHQGDVDSAFQVAVSFTYITG